MHYIVFNSYGDEYFACDHGKLLLDSDQSELGTFDLEKITCDDCLKSKDYQEDIDYEFDDIFSNLNELIDSYKKVSRFHKKNLSPEKWIEIAKSFYELETWNNFKLLSPIIKKEFIIKDEFVINWIYNKWQSERYGLEMNLDHSCYKALIILGKSNINKMFQFLKEDWIITYALRIILNDEPKITDENFSLDKIVQEWLNWGKEKGYINE